MHNESGTLGKCFEFYQSPSEKVNKQGNDVPVLN
jgi:hypothetical protein